MEHGYPIMPLDLHQIVARMVALQVLVRFQSLVELRRFVHLLPVVLAEMLELEQQSEHHRILVTFTPTIVVPEAVEVHKMLALASMVALE
jgi:hypothetical protein